MRDEESLQTAPEERRNARLVAAIRDAGYRCLEVVEAAKTLGDAWLVLCNDQLLYLASVDEKERLQVEPIVYNDSVTPARP